ncbi:MAG: hypothetical protein OSB75_11110 [Dehalococcoidia bacterium]|nr:hypothetical protein [Dehalococcoidia bacterium]
MANLRTFGRPAIKELKASGFEGRPTEEILAARNNSSPDEEMAALEQP